MSGPAPTLGARERELLLCCARLDGEGPHCGRAAELVREGLDWEALCLHALLHSVAPLVHLRLSGLAEYEQVPAAARRRLLGLSHRAAYQNRHFAAEHREVVEAVGREGIELMVPKGISLVELIYGGHERRPLIDLVYLVRHRDLDATVRALERRGYAPRPEPRAHAAWRWSCPVATMTLQREVSIVVMILTGAVSRPRVHSFDLAGVWSRAERVRIAGVEALIPSPEDLVIYLCAQADVHGYLNSVADAIDPAHLLFAGWANNRLVRFVDIRETVRHHRGRLDWRLLASSAERSGLAETVRVGLELTERLLGPATPDCAIDQLGAKQRHWLRGWLFDAVRSQADGARAPSAAKRRVGAWWIGLGSRRRWQLIPLLFLAEFAFCDVSSLRHRHPRWPRAAVALAYPFRSTWVLLRSVAAVVARLIGAASHRTDGPPVRRFVPRRQASP